MLVFWLAFKQASVTAPNKVPFCKIFYYKLIFIDDRQREENQQSEVEEELQQSHNIGYISEEIEETIEDTVEDDIEYQEENSPIQRELPTKGKLFQINKNSRLKLENMSEQLHFQQIKEVFPLQPDIVIQQYLKI